MAIDINIPIEDAVTDGSLNPVTSNAVFDALALKANSNDLATVATTGDYNDLSNLPSIPAAQVNADWNATSGVAEILNKPTIASGTVTSVGLTMPNAFTVANSPITSSGDIAVTAAGLANQYIRGDGTLATFPTSSGGGNSVNYYLNGGTAASVATYYQMSKTAVIGTGVDFSLAGNGLISQWLTDVSDPNVTEIPAGAWNFEMFFSASSSGGTPKFYVELLKYSGGIFTTIANNSLAPEPITSGTAIDLYLTSVAVPLTAMLTTDRIALRVYIVDSVLGRTIINHTQDSHLCQIITTFSSGLSSINGLTEQTQYLAVGTSGTDFAINSATDTHTFNLPTASATNRGALSSANWSTFNGKAEYAPRVQSVVSSAIVTPTNLNDLVKITAQAVGLTLANPTGTFDEGKDLIIRIKDNGTARAIAYGTKYRAIGVTLPTTTVVSKTTYLGLIYNLTDDTYDVIGVTTQA